MIGIYIIVGIIMVYMILTNFLKAMWLKSGIYAGMVLGIISLVILAFYQAKGAENFMLEFFFIVNMVLPVLFSIEIHAFRSKKQDKADNSIKKKRR
jgi:glycopeptide antibiotics resistance protein